MKWLAILLTVIFVIAKLLNIVTWSWWLVFTPTIIYFAVALIVLIAAFIIALLS